MMVGARVDDAADQHRDDLCRRRQAGQEINAGRPVDEGGAGFSRMESGGRFNLAGGEGPKKVFAPLQLRQQK